MSRITRYSDTFDTDGPLNSGNWYGYTSPFAPAVVASGVVRPVAGISSQRSTATVSLKDDQWASIVLKELPITGSNAGVVIRADATTSRMYQLVIRNTFINVWVKESGGVQGWLAGNDIGYVYVPQVDDEFLMQVVGNRVQVYLTSAGVVPIIDAVDTTYTLPSGSAGVDSWTPDLGTTGALDTFACGDFMEVSNPQLVSYDAPGEATLSVDSDYPASGDIYMVVTSSPTTPSWLHIYLEQDHTGSAALYAENKPAAASVEFTATGLPDNVPLYAHYVQMEVA